MSKLLTYDKSLKIFVNQLKAMTCQINDHKVELSQQPRLYVTINRSFHIGV